MKYFSMFSGIGGFELGIDKAWRNTNIGPQENTGNASRDKSFLEETQNNEQQNDSKKVEHSCDTSGTLFQNRQKQSNTQPQNMDGATKTVEISKHIQQSGAELDRTRTNLSNDEKILLESRGITDIEGNDKSLCVGYSEIDKYAIATYESHFGGHKNYGDAKKIDPEQLPDFDLLVGGFPCQAFSIAGKRRGFEDTRGTMFFEIARILKRKQPRMFLLENVKGLLNHDGGNTFTKILQTIDELGYDAEWQVLNSKHFGVPQNRERVFIVGHLRGKGGQQIFPIGTNNQETFSENAYTVSATTGAKKVYQYPTLDTMYKKGLGSKQPRPCEIKYYRNDKRQHSRVYDVEGISPTLAGASKLSGDCTPKIKAVLTPDRVEKRQNGRRFKEEGEPSFTVTSQDIHGVTDGFTIRRLTPVECERLQGFPDGWTRGSDTQRYKQLGNAVTVNVIEAIMKEIMRSEWIWK